MNPLRKPVRASLILGLHSPFREIGTRSQGQDNQDLLRAEARNRRQGKEGILSLIILRICIAFAFSFFIQVRGI